MKPRPLVNEVGARFITRRQRAARLGISIRTDYRLESQGYLPRPVRIGPGLVRYSLAEVEAFERKLLEDRGAAQ